MSVTISIRVEEKTKDEIEELGYTPSEYIKTILKKELKMERRKRALERLKTKRLPPGGRTGTEITRKLRDSR